MSQQHICFIGAGNMSRSIVSGLINSDYPPHLLSVTNPSRPKLDAMAADFNVNVLHDNLAAAEQADVIILGVKPQIMQQVCEQLGQLDLSDKLIVTLAAGITAKRYLDYFKQPVKLIRSMPNTPTQLGTGLTGLFASNTVSQAQKQLCEKIMATGGEIVWVEQEQELNHVIALAGSAPAYFFLFVEAMIESAVNKGVDPDKARHMAQQAILGSAQMIIQNPELSLAQLRNNVTSKGGTTAQAIETFEAGNLRALVDEAMSNCIARAEAMAEQF